MRNVFYVKDMDRNLISYGQVTEKHKIVSVGNNAKIFENDNLIAIAKKENELYKMRSIIYNREANLNVTRNSE